MVNQITKKYDTQFAPLLELCPGLPTIISHMLILRLGFRVGSVDWTLDMKDWSEQDCKNVGRSMATFLRYVQSGEEVIEAWKLNYPQLLVLFNEVGEREQSER